MTYTIKSRTDLEKLSEKYDDNQLFRSVETGEDFTLPELRFFIDECISEWNLEVLE